MWTKLNHYSKLPLRRKLIVCEALIALLLARFAIAVIPFRHIAAWLGTPGVESCKTATQQQIEFAEMVGWAISRLGIRVPWNARCLTQAIAAANMLRSRGLEGTITFGAARDGDGELIAHAWFRFGPCLVTGGTGHEQFEIMTVLARVQQ